MRNEIYKELGPVRASSIEREVLFRHPTILLRGVRISYSWGKSKVCFREIKEAKRRNAQIFKKGKKEKKKKEKKLTSLFLLWKVSIEKDGQNVATPSTNLRGFCSPAKLLQFVLHLCSPALLLFSHRSLGASQKSSQVFGFRLLTPKFALPLLPCECDGTGSLQSAWSLAEASFVDTFTLSNNSSPSAKSSCFMSFNSLQHACNDPACTAQT